MDFVVSSWVAVKTHEHMFDTVFLSAFVSYIRWNGNWCDNACTFKIQVQNHVFISSACFQAFITCKFVFTNDERTTQAKLKRTSNKMRFSFGKCNWMSSNNSKENATQRVLQHNDFIELLPFIILLLYKIRIETKCTTMSLWWLKSQY